MALFVEPGTRLGGTLCANLRTAALEEGLMPVAPCTHIAECPLVGRRDRGWCHVHETLADMASPGWLTALAESARLPKQTLSYSYMLLRRMNETEMAAYEAYMDDDAPLSNGSGVCDARLLSDAFLVPKYGLARYACSERGLLLIPDAVAYDAGARVKCRIGEKPSTDSKSGALIAERDGKPRENVRLAPRPRRADERQEKTRPAFRRDDTGQRETPARMSDGRGRQADRRSSGRPQRGTPNV
jgi:hypothetical protein